MSSAFAAASLGKGDVAVLVSYTGQTPDMLETFKVLRQTGATTIAITRYGRNPISDGADIPLCVSSAETALRSGATGSRIAQLNVVDILYTAVSGRTYSQIKERPGADAGLPGKSPVGRADLRRGRRRESAPRPA